MKFMTTRLTTSPHAASILLHKYTNWAIQYKQKNSYEVEIKNAEIRVSAEISHAFSCQFRLCDRKI